MSNVGSGSNSMEAFDRMKLKVEGLEAQAEVMTLKIDIYAHIQWGKLITDIENVSPH